MAHTTVENYEVIPGGVFAQHDVMPFNQRGPVKISRNASNSLLKINADS